MESCGGSKAGFSPRLALQVTSPGRNEPCPCGSGKKFKRCHGSGLSQASTTLDDRFAAVEQMISGKFALVARGDIDREHVDALVHAAVERMKGTAPRFDYDAAVRVLPRYMRQEPAPITGGAMHIDMYSDLVLTHRPEAAAIYWLEMDQLIEITRAKIFRLAASRIAQILECADTSNVAHAARQLIEITDFAVYYQFATTSIANIFTRMLADRDRRGFFTCATLENIVRAPASDASARFAAASRAIGVDERPAAPHDVGEMSATIAKQAAILRWVAEHHDATDARLVEYSDCLGDAYDVLSGLAHVTPLLLGSVKPQAVMAGRLAEVIPLVATQVALAAATLLDLLFFDERLRGRMWPIFKPRFAS